MYEKILFVALVLLAIIITIITIKNVKSTETLEETSEDEFEEQIYAQIQIEEQDFDFGLISVKDTVSYTYQIKNISDEPLIVTNVISNCNCIDYEYNKQPLQKNQVLYISTKFIATKDKIDAVNNLMLVECNIEMGAAVLSMSGYISEQ
ncbi:DUF1573 domain-containing protein [Bizionia hallyeonensis]|uniref:DUF1573 domain-containing protein n=1 Tax=Bizionia hallyeonensis TaxID=1123757 RepID=A0ABW0C2X0_9FLAO